MGAHDARFSMIAVEQPEVARVGTGERLRALVETARPRQWVKNLLVFAAPGAAGLLSDFRELGRGVAVFVAFCLASAAAYYVNDIVDRHADRLHPRKRHRPLARGAVPVALAAAVAVGLAAGAIGVAVLAGGDDLAVVLGAYVALTLAYSLALKREPILDMGCIAAGFVLRAIAGGVAADVPISQWFLIVTSFVSLFVAAGKRHAEHVALGADGGAHRATLAAYSDPFLRTVRAVAAAVAIAAYCLWAFERPGDGGQAIWFQLSIVPFVLAMLCYERRAEAGGGGAPEDVVLGDGTIQGTGLAWAVLVGIGVYAG